MSDAATASRTDSDTNTVPYDTPLESLESTFRSLLPFDLPFEKEYAGGSDRIDSTNFVQLAAALKCDPRTKPWSDHPRLYTLLRVAGCDCREVLKEPFVRKGCLAAGLSEYGVPFNRDSLPLVLRREQPDITKRLLSVQETVCSSHTDTELQERMPLHKHWNFPPLQIRREKLLHGTEGAFSRVSEVELRSIRLARKSIHRQWINQDGAPDKELEEDRQVQMKLFINELSILRRVSHRHIVKLCGSYTEEYNFVFLLNPVAERTLEQVLNEGGNGNHDWLSKSYGCLSAALSWMHSHRIKHRDIKPSNILVAGQDQSVRVMFCDFGSALEANVKGSLTTEGRPQLQTWRYIAPEASSNWDKRNESTDLWSLGCVFIEIDTILCEQRLSDLHEHIHGSLSPTERMKSDGSDLCYFQRPHALYTWLGGLHATDDGPGLWTKEMLHVDASCRPTAKDLETRIRAHHRNSSGCYMCESCVESPDQPRSSSLASRPTPDAIGYDSVHTTDTVRTANGADERRFEAPSPPRGRHSSTTEQDSQLNASRRATDSYRSLPPSHQLERLRSPGSRFMSESRTASDASFARPSVEDFSSQMTTSLTSSTGGHDVFIFEAQIQRIEVHGDSGLTDSERSELGDHVTLYESIRSRHPRTGRPKAFETFRELHVRRERTSDRSVGHVFWLPISDFLVQRAGMRILLSYSDCNHKETVKLIQGQTIYDFLYRPQKQNRALLLEFRSESDARDFARILMRPFGNFSECHFSQSLDLKPGRINAQWRFLDRSAENEGLPISRVAKRVQHFTCHRTEDGSADRGILITGHEDAATAQVVIYWLSPQLDMSIDDSDCSVEFRHLHFAEYISDARDLTFAQTRKQRGNFASAELRKVSALKLKFNTARDMNDCIADLSEWQLDLLIPVKNVRRERIKLLPSKSLGPAHLFFFTRTVADRTKAALVFRLRRSTSENVHWISSRVPPARDERFLSNKVGMNLERCIEGDRLVLSSMEAIKSTVSKTKTKQSFSIEFGDEDDHPDKFEQCLRNYRSTAKEMSLYPTSSAVSSGPSGSAFQSSSRSFASSRP